MEKIHNIWKKHMDNSIIPFLRSKTGMIIIIGLIIYILLY